jgi:alkylation response protein AidB-like acyl-CoA dehydrogenase
VFFGFDDDQIGFRDAVRDLLDKECPPEVVRGAWESPPGALDRAVWSRLDDMGVLTTLVPEAAGGLGLDERSLVLVLEETGRAALPHPIVDSAAVAAPLIAESGGGPAARTEDLGMVATDLAGPHVACAADADWLLLRDPASPGLHLVDPRSVVLRSVDTVDRGRRAATVEWLPAPGTLVVDDPAAVEDAADRGAFGAAAQLVGLGQRMLDLTVAYVIEREQFGVPIGSFQAVKHRLADALRDLAFARPAVHRAAHSLATRSPDRRRDVSMAKALSSDAARAVGRAALQCHGAIGYTVEHDLHLYLKRTWALAVAWGDAASHRDRVGAAIGL